MTNYDLDDDNLTDVYSLAKLNAIRYDLNGDGLPDNCVPYATVILGGQLAGPAATRMGYASGCKGYELTANLTFTGGWAPSPSAGATIPPGTPPNSTATAAPFGDPWSFGTTGDYPMLKAPADRQPSTPPPPSRAPSRPNPKNLTTRSPTTPKSTPTRNTKCKHRP